VCDDWVGLETFLEPGREVLVVRSGEEVATQLAALSAARARKIGAAARQRVMAEHTYAHRARLLTRLFGERLPAPAVRREVAAHA
jgi:spore maturation protein CgeB